MFNNIIYLADSNVQSDLQNTDITQVTSQVQVKPQPDIPLSETSGENQNTGLLVAILIIVFILVSVLIGLYLNLKNQPDVRLSGLLSSAKSKNQSKDKINGGQSEDNSPQIDEIFSEDKTDVALQNEKEESVDVSKYDAQTQDFSLKENISTSNTNSSESSLNLGTPKSVEKCIRSFLEITQDA